MRNSVRCTTCLKWVHARCSGSKRITNRMAESFVCRVCSNTGVVRDGDMVDDGTHLVDIERVDRFRYLGDTINSGGGCEIAVTRRCRSGWMKFNELSSVLCGRRFTMTMKGTIYKVCVRAAIVYGSETWSIKSKEVGILRRTERAMARKMCGVKLSNRKSTCEQAFSQRYVSPSLRRLEFKWDGQILRRRPGDGQ